MNEIVDIYICPMCGSMVLEDTDARRSNAYEVYCPMCDDSNDKEVMMDKLDGVLQYDNEVKTAVSNFEILLRRYAELKKKET